MGVGFLTRLFNHFPLALLRHVRPSGADQAICDVAKDGIVEEKGFLLDETDLGPPPGKIKGFKIVAADLDRTRELRLGRSRWLLVVIVIFLVVCL